MTYSFILLAGMALASARSVTAEAATPIPGSERPGGLVFSDQLLLRSEKIGQTFLIQVAKPLESQVAGQRAPVIYTTDGLIFYGVYASATRVMPGEKLIPPAYVVAISYPEAETADTLTLRLRDLMHRPALHRTGKVSGGGGGAFEDFLLNDVKPLIEKRYAVDPARSILAGHSLGGLFAANVLANHPDAFAGYIIGSPSVHYDEEVLKNVRAVGARGAHRRVFIGVGELEPQMVSRADALEQALSGSSFVVKRMTFLDEMHTSVLGVLASHGLRWVFQ